MSNTLKCFDENCRGFSLPENPIDLRSVWLCSSCSTLTAADKVENVYNRFDMELKMIENCQEDPQVK